MTQTMNFFYSKTLHVNSDIPPRSLSNVFETALIYRLLLK